MELSGNSQRQRGAIGLMVAGTLLIACLFLMLAVDSGRLYLEKRKLQRVADMAALEAVSRAGNCLGSGQSSAEAYALDNARGRNGFDPTQRARRFTVTCGRTAASGGRRNFIADAQGSAVQVSVSETVPASLVLGGLFGEQVTLAASAVADRLEPVGRLALRSSLATVDTQQSALLNSVFGGLLGGSVSLDAAGWQGLVNSDINLLNYLELLAVDQGLSLGDYQQVLGADVALGDLLDIAADVLSQGADSANVEAVAGLQALSAAVPAGLPLLRLGDVLAVQSGVTAAGLDVGLNTLQLAQAMVQLANSQNAVVAEIPLDVQGIVGVSVKLKVIEPPQLSAIGNPELARENPYGEHQIYVRTAQVRSLISIDLPLLSGAAGLVNAVSDLLAPVTGLLNSVLGLNLDPLCVISCTGTKIDLVPPPVRLDINLDIASSEARVIDYNCPGSGEKSLSIEANTASADVRVGQISAADQSAIFSSLAVPHVLPMPLAEISTRQCSILGCESSWTPYARTGLRANTTVLASGPIPHSFINPPDLGDSSAAASRYGFTSENVVSSLVGTLSGLELQTYRYDASSPNHMGDIVGSATALVSSAYGVVKNMIEDLLSPLLDPLLNTLLSGLGIDLASTEVGGELTCGTRAALVI